MSDPSTSVTIKLVVGAGIAAITALTTFGLYLYLKEDEDEADALLLRSRTNRSESAMKATSSTDKLKVRIKKDAIGAVIGRGGENVRKIQQQTKTKITFEEDKDAKSGDKFAVITGSSEAVFYAQEVIRRTIAEIPVFTTLDFSIPFQAVGAVIGRNGEVVRRLQDQTGCRINVAKLAPSAFHETNPVTLKGTEHQITDAKTRINEIVSRFEVPLKKASSKKLSSLWTDEEWQELGERGLQEDDYNSSDELDFATATKKILQEESLKNDTKPKISTSKVQEVVPPPLIHSSYAAAVVDGNSVTGSSAAASTSSTLSPDIPAQVRAVSVSDKSIGTSPNNSWTDSSSSDPASPECVSIPYDVLYDEPLHEELIATLDDTLHVYVSHVESPSKFYLQIVGPKATALDKLSNDMTDFYEVNSRREKVTALKVGDVVASTFTPQDETWYRARVMDVQEKHPHDDTEVTVFFLDFGGESVHKKKNLCNLKHDFLTALPFQAVESTLWNVLPIDDNDWSEEAVNAFSLAVHCSEWTEVLCRPKGKVKIPFGKTSAVQTAVELIDFKNCNPRIDIGQSLINKNYAKRCTQTNSGDNSDSGLSASPSVKVNANGSTAHKVNGRKGAMNYTTDEDQE